jgi:hypothetical protein
VRKREIRIFRLPAAKYDELVAKMPAVCRFVMEEVPGENIIICRATAGDDVILVAVPELE